MKLTVFSSIGGLRIIGRDRREGASRDVLDLKVQREDISDMAIGMLQEIGMDASPKLIAKCRELIEAVDGDIDAAQPGRRSFIRQLEDVAGESKRTDETDDEYFERLKTDFPEVWARHGVGEKT